MGKYGKSTISMAIFKSYVKLPEGHIFIKKSPRISQIYLPILTKLDGKAAVGSAHLCGRHWATTELREAGAFAQRILSTAWWLPSGNLT